MQLENLLTITEVAKRCPGRPSTNTVWRWCRHGIKSRNADRIFLQHVRRGSKLYTSKEALEQFFKDTADADRAYFDKKAESPRPPANRSAAAHRKSVEAAKANMDKAGIR